jgi:hypothetical protein
MEKSLLYALCVFCGYSSRGYYQEGTHHVLCPWYKVGGLEQRKKDLRCVVAALFKERKKTIEQQAQSGTDIRCSGCGRHYSFAIDECPHC